MVSTSLIGKLSESIQRDFGKISSFSLSTLLGIVNDTTPLPNNPALLSLQASLQSRALGEIKRRESDKLQQFIASSFETERQRSVEEITNVFESQQLQFEESQETILRSENRLNELLGQVQNASIEVKDSSFLSGFNNTNTKTLLIGVVVIALIAAVVNSKVRK